MTSQSLPPPSTVASPSVRSPIEDQMRALLCLAESGLRKDDIATLARLGSAGLRRTLHFVDREGASKAFTLLDALEGAQEEIMDSYLNIVCGHEPGEQRSPIDRNAYAPTATPPPAVPVILSLPTTPAFLRPPLPSGSDRRTISTGSPSSPGGSSPTDITPAPTNYRVEKRRTPTKSTRTQLYCPDCSKPIKNGFDNHFRGHLEYLLGCPADHVDAHEAIGCGYCQAHGILVQGGQVFHGVKKLVEHVRDSHASNPDRLHWEIDFAFNHVLSAQYHFRRHILQLIGLDRQQQGRGSDIPSLSWGPTDRPLLKQLQAMSGQLDQSLSSHNPNSIAELLNQVYIAAAKKWQEPLAQWLPPVPPALPLQQTLPHHPPRQAPKDDFVGIGQHLDTLTPSHYPEMPSPSAHSPAPHPQHLLQRAPQHGPDVEMTESDVPILQPPFTTPTIAFQGPAPWSTPPPSQEWDHSLDSVLIENGLDERQLFSSYVNDAD